MDTQTQLTDERAEWLKARLEFVGGSEVPALFNCDDYKSPYTLYAVKLGLLPDEEAGEAAQWGLDMQPLIARRWAEREGYEIIDHGQHVIQRNPAFPHLAVTLDYGIRPKPGEEDRGLGVLEVKLHGREWEDGKPPMRHLLQTQSQLAVTGRTWGAIVPFFGERLKLGPTIWFERNETIIAAIGARVEEFWDLVQRREPPRVDDSESTARTLARLYPEANGETVDFDEDDMVAVDRWDALKKTANAAYADMKQYENRLRARLGSATFGLLPDGRRLSLKTQTRGAHEVRESTFRKLHLSKARG